MSKRIDLLAQEPGRFLYVRKERLHLLYIAFFDRCAQSQWILQSRNSETSETTRDEYLLQHELESAMRAVAPIYQWDARKVEQDRIKRIR